MGRVRANAFLLVIALAVVTLGFTWPWQMGRGWPNSSRIPVTLLDHPTIETRLSEIEWDVASGYRFAVFGDQRALADGEWQALIARLASRSVTDDRLLFIVDTGDIVRSGRHGDQFDRLRSILDPVRRLPYLVGIGNHEVDSNRHPLARTHTKAFLGYLDADFSEDRMYYRKDIGAVRFLFMDTNDLVYGDDGKLGGLESPDPRSRAETQMRWLVRELDPENDEASATTILVMHHPFILSSKKHQSTARSLWSYTYDGRTLPDIIADGGVDLILTGHTHTYERFRLRRDDGRQFHVVNISGRPRTSFLWIGDGNRRARDIDGNDREWFTERGWRDLERWSVTQEDAMLDGDRNQFALFAVDGRGGVEMEVVYLEEDSADGVYRAPSVRLK